MRQKRLRRPPLRTRKIFVRLTEDELKRLEERAVAAGYRVSEYVRLRLRYELTEPTA